MTNQLGSSSRFVSNSRTKQKGVGFVILMAMAVLLVHPALGQQAKTGDAAKSPVARKKARGRLPAYFAAVVSQQQREAIYKVQGEYEAQLEKLRAQIDTLIAERDREVDGVLSAEQLAEVTKKRDEAKKKRAARSSAKSTSTKATDG